MKARKQRNVLIAFTLLCIPILISSNPMTTSHDYDPKDFIKPLSLQNESLTYFFWCYNHPFYTKRFLPTCLLPIKDLLEYTKGQSDPCGYAHTIISIFHQRMKDVQWENPFAFAQLLDAFPTLLAPIIEQSGGNLITQSESDYHALRNLIAAKYTQEKSLWDSQPEAFVDSLSRDICDYIQNRRTSSDVKNILVRFIESILDKLIWDHKDEIYVWKSFKVIGSQLQTLYERGLIPDMTTLNHCLWSLIYRFCYFIELSGSCLPVNVYSEIKKDLETESVEFLKYDEQERFILPKTELLGRALRLGETKARLYPRGILTDV